MSDRSDDQRQRLQKVLAAAGVASRRAAEELIVQGRVSVNGQVVRELGTRVDPAADLLRVDGVPVQTDQSRVYFLLNKPAGVVSSMHDERGRPDLSQYAEEIGVRVFNVGRLDEATRGLLLLTNDGELSQRLAHPSFGVEKTYLAKVRGAVDAATRRRLLDGVDLEDGPIAADAVKVVDAAAGESLVEVRLHSGRNRIVRRMLAATGHPVVDLVRTRFGPLRLGTLQAGRMRELTKVELGQVLRLMLDGGHR